ncbi:NAD(+)/NADH kinase [Nitratidesulfovibrio vulgaris]|uniref:NAD kinase n=2 Tax=Nitratidesulfovibrio vulgaris TaxID=881 RepID=NADK_NITV2|nr:NAD(+)/NADH kinase [Nitratidesulfovibrio vulgaris]A1VCX9.1 RecName: Full=NAD kinase; AltName: Full=ATP-dependent NAD kinase [Nitratidesulfovibrio vulgaris DP4]Q72AV2.1 RecName: Full=NAD kinase; AltName: Full=ATP-dependent NAD kinase [Nitratidesulfovibrio vulgaris str. Hildenborough]GEB80788.1 NAD kinase [Desulfovibrio desulfuricans]AAS96364.1 ATP-NAD kinase domain protein [Nitratidesulfovibrio vulgaris str. Hildenborough]ABM28295.1 NAD(+) kinase [Nitratidesulfovibrio vulgaris DP4]ADP86575.
MHPIRSVLIVTKPGHPTALDLAQDIGVWLTRRGVSCRILEGPGEALPLRQLAADAGLVLVLGGDGTMLGVARRLAGTGVPLLGINLGRVGFLAEVPAGEWAATLERLLAAPLRVERRLALRFGVERGGVEIFQGDAVNDVVINRGALARVITLDIDVDGERLAGLRADGLIISTPTGATGYAVSARGPLMDPALDAFTVTPICPFLGNFPPLVLGGGSVCSVRIREQGTEVHATIDGQEGIALRSGDRITLTGLRDGLCFATLGGGGYCARLRACGFVRDHACTLPDMLPDEGGTSTDV